MGGHLICLCLPDQPFLILNQILQGDHALNMLGRLFAIFAKMVRQQGHDLPMILF